MITQIMLAKDFGGAQRSFIDLALALAMQHKKHLIKPPVADHLQRIGQLYKPLRSVAARLYWWSYLEGKEPG